MKAILIEIPKHDLELAIRVIASKIHSLDIEKKIWMQDPDILNSIKKEKKSLRAALNILNEIQYEIKDC